MSLPLSNIAYVLYGVHVLVAYRTKKSGIKFFFPIKICQHKYCIETLYVHVKKEIRSVSVEYWMEVIADHDDTGDDEHITINT